MLINTKFKIEKKTHSQVKIGKSIHASLLGINYSDMITFKKEFGKIIWLTYRRNFTPLLPEMSQYSNLTSDAGWGCVIRCTQMLIANCLRQIFN
jgi:hypothetical protein